MIISQLNGGLGNQLFQYAMARSLALDTRQEFSLDTSRTLMSRDRKYALGHFNIPAGFTKMHETLVFLLPWQGAKDAVIKRLGWEVVTERHFHYAPIKVDPLKKNYLIGYWQSPKYFQSHEREVRQDFTFKSQPTGKNVEVLKLIHDINSVCLHVRRGDYVANPMANRTHGVCGLDYYKRAIKILAEKIPQPHFFVFSDDSLWTKENIKIDFPTTYINNNSTDEAHEDLRLMSACKNFIIANSSLSWWGAWLGSYDKKTVIAPKDWFVDKSFDDKDLIPKNWLRT